MQDRLTLAVNTATSLLSVALVRGGKTLYLHESAEPLAQGQGLLGYVQAGLERAGADYPDLDLLAVVTGPGSFTGIRLGLAALRGLALAAEKPLIGITSFDLFAAPKAGFVNIVAVESWRKELYFAVLDEEAHPLIACSNETPEAFKARLPLPAGTPLRLSGDAAPALAALFPEAEIVPPANAVRAAEVALARFASGGPFPKPTPYYLREADVTISHRAAKTVATS